MRGLGDAYVLQLLRWTRKNDYDLSDEEWALCDHLLGTEFQPRAPFWGLHFVLMGTGFRLYRSGTRVGNTLTAMMLWLFGYEFGCMLRGPYSSQLFLYDLSGQTTPLGERALTILEGNPKIIPSREEQDVVVASINWFHLFFLWNIEEKSRRYLDRVTRGGGSWFGTMHVKDRRLWAWELREILLAHPDELSRVYWRVYFLYHSLYTGKASR